MWSRFWQDLNIRKALALLFGLAMIIGSLAAVFTGLGQTKPDLELVRYGLSGIITVTTTLIGYYFGYSNGLNTKNKYDDDSL